MKGYKALNKDYTCRGFKYDIGQTYKHEGKLEMCKSGFHFCANAVDCFGYYPADSIIVEVEATGDVQQEGTKCVTNEIRIIRELTQDEIKCGNYNSGGYNSGDCNSGNYNSGNYNSGNYNSGFFCDSGLSYEEFYCFMSEEFFYHISAQKLTQ